MAGTYQIDYAAKAVGDLRGLRRFDAQAVLTVINQHLPHAPTQESRSRIKRMTQPFWCQYRLRAGDFRVYYDVDDVGRSVKVSRIMFKGTDPTPEQNP